MGDPALGACGSTCAQDTASTGNVYGNNRPLPQAQDPATIRTGNPLNPSPSISTTCTEEPVLSTSPPTVTRSRQGQEPVTIRMTNTGAPTQAADTTCDENNPLSTDPPDVTLISPVGIAPDAPTTVPAGLSLQPPPALSSSPPPSQGPAGPTTPPLDDYGRTDVPTSVTKVPQGGPTQASEESEPPTYGEPLLAGLGQTPARGRALRNVLLRNNLRHRQTSSPTQMLQSKATMSLHPARTARLRLRRTWFLPRRPSGPSPRTRTTLKVSHLSPLKFRDHTLLVLMCHRSPLSAVWPSSRP